MRFGIRLETVIDASICRRRRHRDGSDIIYLHLYIYLLHVYVYNIINTKHQNAQHNVHCDAGFFSLNFKLLIIIDFQKTIIF